MGTRDWWERDDVDPSQRTESTAAGLQATTAEEADSTTDANERSGARRTTDGDGSGEPAPDAARPGRQTDDAGWPLGLDAPPPAVTRTEASADGQTITPMSEPDQPTLEAAQGGLAADASGRTLEPGVYGSTDPRYTTDDERAADKETTVDLPEAGPDGTALRPGLTDALGTPLSVTRDLGGALPEDVALPGSDRLSGLMDPVALAEQGRMASALGGRTAGGGDPRLAMGGIITEPDIRVDIREEDIEIIDSSGGGDPAGSEGGLDVQLLEDDIEIIDSSGTGGDSADSDGSAGDSGALKVEIGDVEIVDETSEEELTAPDDAGGTGSTLRDPRWADPKWGTVDPAEGAEGGATVVVESGGKTFVAPAGQFDPPDSAGPEYGPEGGAPNQYHGLLQGDPGYVDPAENQEGLGPLPVVTDVEGGGVPRGDSTMGGGGESGGPDPQTEQTGAGVTLSAEPAWKVDGLAAINMETGQAAGPPDAALLVGGTEASGGLAMSPPSAESPLGPEPQPGQEGQEESAPGGPGEDDGMP